MTEFVALVSGGRRLSYVGGVCHASDADTDEPLYAQESHGHDVLFPSLCDDEGHHLWMIHECESTHTRIQYDTDLNDTRHMAGSMKRVTLEHAQLDDVRWWYIPRRSYNTTTRLAARQLCNGKT